MDKKALSERDICSKFITPNLAASGWDVESQVREEVGFTDGRIYVRGKMHVRGAQKRADYILYYKPNIPIAVIEAKDNKHSVSAGIQQALGYRHLRSIIRLQPRFETTTPEVSAPIRNLPEAPPKHRSCPGSVKSKTRSIRGNSNTDQLYSRGTGLKITRKLLRIQRGAAVEKNLLESLPVLFIIGTQNPGQ